MGRADILIDLIEETQAERVAEIGIARGRTTRAILESNCSNIIKEYWAVDPWSTIYSRDWYRDQEFFDKEAYDVYKYMCFFPQLKIIRLPSVDASKVFYHYDRDHPGKY